MKLQELFEDIHINKSVNYFDISPDEFSNEPLIVDGNVDLSESGLSKIHWEFKSVNGDFNVTKNDLTSLKGSPSECRSFGCNRNKRLQSLQYGPKKVRSFYAIDCDLHSLQFAPDFVRFEFNISKNKNLKSLEFAPENMGFLVCNDNTISLKNINKYVKKCTQVDFRNTTFLDNGEGALGLVLINELNEIKSDDPALKIIEKYLGQGKRGMMLAQAELIENGYEDYAKL